MDNSIRDTLILPAEWHAQSGIQLTWPHSNTDWLPYLNDINSTFIELVKIISKYEYVLIVTPNIDNVKQQLSNSISSDEWQNIRFAQCSTNDTWARDHAAITLLNDNGERLLLNFKFNGWGNKFPAELDNAITNNLYADDKLKGDVENHDYFVLEGGSIESDGCGTIFTTSQCLLAPNRNQPLSQQEIEAKLKSILNAKRIIWLDYGNLIGDDTDGHIDTIVRIVPNNTLLYVGTDDKDDEQYEDLKQLENQLKELRTLSGAPYILRKLPSPNAIYNDGERLPATYANFVIINEAIICPTYNQPQKDEEAMQILRETFPDRQIFGVDSRVVIKQHGSLHCLTMQYPIGVIK